MLLIGLLGLHSCRTHARQAGVFSPTVGWALAHQSLAKQMSYRFAYRPIVWGRFLSWASLLSDDFNLCQIDIKLARSLSLWLESSWRHVRVP